MYANLRAIAAAVQFYFYPSNMAINIKIETSLKHLIHTFVYILIFNFAQRKGKMKRKGIKQRSTQKESNMANVTRSTPLYMKY